MSEWTFSEALESCRLPDTLSGEAYEATPAHTRGWLKTTLALVQALHGFRPARTRTETLDTAAGFGFTQEQSVAPWAVVVLGPHCVSAVRLSALLMTARLAGIEELFAVCTTLPQRPELLTALELTGVEQLFLMDCTQLTQFLRELPSGGGRILNMGEPNCPNPAQLPLWTDHAPRLVLSDTNPELRERLLATHPDAILIDAERALSEGLPCDAAYGSATLPAPLHLTVELAEAWASPNPAPDWFMNTTCSLFTAH